MTNYFDVYCNDTDICSIDCQSILSCKYLRLHCSIININCYVHCDYLINNNFVECPHSGNYSLWSTQEPSSQPTFEPSKIPSEFPSTIPSTIPTRIPLVEETGGSKNGSFDIVDILLIVGLAGGIFIILAIVVCCAFRAHKREEHTRKVEMKKVELMATSTDGARSTGTDILKHTTPGDRDLMKNVDLQKVQVATPRSETDIESNMGIDNGDASPSDDEIADAADGVGQELALAGQEDEDDERGGEGSDVEELYGASHVTDGHDMGVGQPEQTARDGLRDVTSATTTATGGGETYGSTGASGGGGKGGETASDDYSTWNQNEVLEWVQSTLEENSIDGDTIESFLNEFSDKYVTGAMLKTLKNDTKKMNQLKLQFKNQSFGIWMAFDTALENLGQTKG